MKSTLSDIFPWEALEAGLDELASLASYKNDATLRNKVKDIISEYSFETKAEPRELGVQPEIGLPVFARAAVAAGNAG